MMVPSLPCFFAERIGDSEAVDFDRLSVTPGARRTRRQKRKANYAPPDRRMNFA